MAFSELACVPQVSDIGHQKASLRSDTREGLAGEEVPPAGQMHYLDVVGFSNFSEN